MKINIVSFLYLILHFWKDMNGFFSIFSISNSTISDVILNCILTTFFITWPWFLQILIDLVIFKLNSLADSFIEFPLLIALMNSFLISDVLLVYLPLLLVFTYVIYLILISCISSSIIELPSFHLSFRWLSKLFSLIFYFYFYYIKILFTFKFLLYKCIIWLYVTFSSIFFKLNA